MSIFNQRPHRTNKKASNNVVIPKWERIQGPQARSLEIRNVGLRHLITPPVSLREAESQFEDMKQRDEQTADAIMRRIHEAAVCEQRQPSETEL